MYVIQHDSGKMLSKDKVSWTRDLKDAKLYTPEMMREVNISGPAKFVKKGTLDAPKD